MPDRKLIDKYNNKFGFTKINYTGKLIWSKTNNSPFNSQIKIFKDKIYVVDSQNSLHCFSLKEGKKIWKFNTDKPLIKSQKKAFLIIKVNINMVMLKYFLLKIIKK